MKARDVLLLLAGGVVALIIVAIVILAGGRETATAPTSTIAPTQTAGPTAEPTASETQRPTSTKYVPHLTAAEAAVRARDVLREAVLSDDFPGGDQLLTWLCSTQDFDQRDLTWLVVCGEGDDSITYRVMDETGEVILVLFN